MNFLLAEKIKPQKYKKNNTYRVSTKGKITLFLNTVKDDEARKSSRR